MTAETRRSLPAARIAATNFLGDVSNSRERSDQHCQPNLTCSESSYLDKMTQSTIVVMEWTCQRQFAENVMPTGRDGVLFPKR